MMNDGTTVKLVYGTAQFQLFQHSTLWQQVHSHTFLLCTANGNLTRGMWQHMARRYETAADAHATGSQNAGVLFFINMMLEQQRVFKSQWYLGGSALHLLSQHDITLTTEYVWLKLLLTQTFQPFRVSLTVLWLSLENQYGQRL